MNTLARTRAERKIPTRRAISERVRIRKIACLLQASLPTAGGRMSRGTRN